MIRILETFVEVLSWLRIIMSSPLLIGIGIGILIYSTNPNSIGMTTGIIVSCIGLFVGIALATKVWKKTDTSTIIQRMNASSEANKNEDCK